MMPIRLTSKQKSRRIFKDQTRGPQMAYEIGANNYISAMYFLSNTTFLANIYTNNLFRGYCFRSTTRLKYLF